MEAECLTLTKKDEFIIKYYMPSNAIVSDMADFFGIFADVTRVKMLSALSIKEMCVGDLTCLLGLNQSTVSHQLKYLRDAGIVRARRCGKIMLYSICNKYVADIMGIGANNLLV